MLTKPKDLDYEIFIFEKYLGLMNHLKDIKEKHRSLEEDLALLDDLFIDGITYEHRFAVRYRAEKKKIIRSNIDLVELVLKVLRRVKETTDSSGKATISG